MCCSAHGAIWYRAMSVTVLLAVFSRKQRSEAAFFPFDQGPGWLQLELNLALLAGGLLVLCVWCCSPGHAMASCRRKECSHVQEKNPTFQSPHCEQFYLNIDSKQTWSLAQGGCSYWCKSFRGLAFTTTLRQRITGSTWKLSKSLQLHHCLLAELRW